MMHKHPTFILFALTIVIARVGVCKGANENNHEARGECGPGLSWSFENGLLTISGIGEMTNYTALNDRPWKDYSSSITSVMIEEGVTSVGYSAFFGFNHITSVSFPSSIALIGKESFAGCNELTSVSIVADVISIGSQAFYLCEGLKSFSLEAKKASIGESAFSDCSYLERVNVSAVVTSIEDNTFYQCVRLTSFVIPPTVTSIGSYAFFGCSKLPSITIPESVTSIKDYAFSYCKSFTSVRIPNNINALPEGAFEQCNLLTSMEIPANIISIGTKAFSNCANLTSVTYLGSHAPVCGDEVFRHVSGLSFACVPGDYNSSSFCELAAYSQQLPDAVRAQHNHCYEVMVCEMDNATVKHRENATEWESHSDGCVEYVCVNDSGSIVQSNCSKDEVCTNNKCEKMSVNEWAIEIGVGSNYFVNNTTELFLTISDLCGIEADKLRIGVKVDDHVLKLIVFVNDEHSAQTIVSTVNKCSSQQTSCPGVFRQFESAKIIISKQVHLSKANHEHSKTILLLTALMTVLNIIYN